MNRAVCSGRRRAMSRAASFLVPGRMAKWSLGPLLALGGVAVLAQAPPAPPPAPTDSANAAGAAPPLTLRRAAELALGNSPEVAAAAAAWQGDQAGAPLAADAFQPAAGLSRTPGLRRRLPGAAPRPV